VAVYSKESFPLAIKYHIHIYQYSAQDRSDPKRCKNIPIRPQYNTGRSPEGPLQIHSPSSSCDRVLSRHSFLIIILHGRIRRLFLQRLGINKRPCSLIDLLDGLTLIGKLEIKRQFRQQGRLRHFSGWLSVRWKSNLEMRSRETVLVMVSLYVNDRLLERGRGCRDVSTRLGVRSKSLLTTMEASLTAKITYIIWMIEDTLSWSENYPFQEGGGRYPLLLLAAPFAF